MVICLERGADLHMFQLMPLPLTVSCVSKIQIGFAFLVPAHLGSPGEMAVKRVCVCVCMHECINCDVQSSQRRRQSSKQGAKRVLGRTWRASNPRRRRRGLRSAKGAEDRDAEGVEGVANGEGVSPLQLTTGSLQRLLKINVVHNRPTTIDSSLGRIKQIRIHAVEGRGLPHIYRNLYSTINWLDYGNRFSGIQRDF